MVCLLRSCINFVCFLAIVLGAVMESMRDPNSPTTPKPPLGVITDYPGWWGWGNRTLRAGRRDQGWCCWETL